MPDIKKPLFNADAAEEYFSTMLTCYRNTANDIFRRDNEGRHASEQHYSAEYQKYLGMQIALREVLDYFGKYELNGWISVEERLPTRDEEENGIVGIVNGNGVGIRFCDATILLRYDFGENVWWSEDYDIEGCKVTHWMPLPEPPKGE